MTRLAAAWSATAARPRSRSFSRARTRSPTYSAVRTLPHQARLGVAGTALLSAGRKGRDFLLSGYRANLASLQHLQPFCRSAASKVSELSEATYAAMRPAPGLRQCAAPRAPSLHCPPHRPAIEQCALKILLPEP